MAHFFEKCTSDFDVILESLPEPILVVGNKKPDGDSLGCISALIAELRELGREVYTFLVEPPDDSIAWMIQPEDQSVEILQDYASLVVVDDFVDSERLGIAIKDNVPIVNIDHHMSRRPSAAPLDGSTYVRLTGDWTIEYWACLPATACLLIDQFIYHEHLWISLFTDTVGFTVNGLTAAKYVNKLAMGLRAQDRTFTDEDQERLYQQFNRIGSLSAFNTMMEATIYQFAGSFNESPIQVLLGIIDSPDIEPAFKTMGTLRAYSDVSVVANKSNGRVSLRSRSYDFDVSKIAQRFGGGGHIRAAGCSLRTGEGFLPDLDILIDCLTEKIEHMRSKVYV